MAKINKQKWKKDHKLKHKKIEIYAQNKILVKIV